MNIDPPQALSPEGITLDEGEQLVEGSVGATRSSRR
jgi:hypothetical protein